MASMKKKKPSGDITLPPAKTKGRKANAFNAFILKHQWMQPYALAIAKAAKANGLDALLLASLLNLESGGTATPKPHYSGGNLVVGIAQINITAHKKITQAQAENPAFAIKWAADYLRQGYTKYGNYRDAYTKWYNPADANREAGWSAIDSARPQGYVWGTSGNVTTPPQTPAERAASTVSYKAALESMTHTQFNTEWAALNNIFYTYQGRKATRPEAEYLIGHGFSEFVLSRALSKNKQFFKSPIYRRESRTFLEVAKTIYGEQLPPGLKLKSLVREAIVNTWSPTTFASYLREQPQYFKSNEFKQGTTTLENSYRQIYGEPDQAAKHAIQEATLGRWNQTQWESYLRNKPEYYNSQEFRQRQGNFLARMGFLDQQQQNPNNNQGDGATVPDNPRIP